MTYKNARIAYETFFNSVWASNGLRGEQVPDLPPFDILQDDLKKAWFDATEAVIEVNNIQDEEISDEDYEKIKSAHNFPPTIGNVDIDKEFIKRLTDCI